MAVAVFPDPGAPRHEQRRNFAPLGRHHSSMPDSKFVARLETEAGPSTLNGAEHPGGAQPDAGGRAFPLIPRPAEVEAFDVGGGFDVGEAAHAEIR